MDGSRHTCWLFKLKVSVHTGGQTENRWMKCHVADNKPCDTLNGYDSLKSSTLENETDELIQRISIIIIIMPDGINK